MMMMMMMMMMTDDDDDDDIFWHCYIKTVIHSLRAPVGQKNPKRYY
jgi:hypothetical protein